jgi:hypothetical protein
MEIDPHRGRSSESELNPKTAGYGGSSQPFALRGSPFGSPKSLGIRENACLRGATRSAEKQSNDAQPVFGRFICAFLAASVFVVARRVINPSLSRPDLPFAPFMAGGAVVAVLFVR